jgi:tRNA(Ile)-lysidine synthase TilS/MesJ
MDEVRDTKAWCLADPSTYLWCSTTKNIQEIHNIFYKMKQLEYSDRPDYNYIREQLTTLLQKEEGTHPSLDTKTLVLSFTHHIEKKLACQK